MLACKVLTWPSTHSEAPNRITLVTMEFSLIKAKITVFESICDSRKASVMVFASGGVHYDDGAAAQADEG